jgi:hypothetical protein
MSEFPEAVAKGKHISIYSPGILPAPTDGRAVVEAPARMHKWYATVIVKDGYVVKVVN